MKKVSYSFQSLSISRTRNLTLQSKIHLLKSRSKERKTSMISDNFLNVLDVKQMQGDEIHVRLKMDLVQFQILLEMNICWKKKRHKDLCNDTYCLRNSNPCTQTRMFP